MEILKIKKMRSDEVRLEASQRLIEMLSNINCEEVSLDMSEPNRAILVNGEENVLGLLMPVMLNA